MLDIQYFKENCVASRMSVSWRLCYGLDLKCPLQAYVLEACSLAFSAIWKALEPLGYRIWRMEAGTQGWHFEDSTWPWYHTTFFAIWPGSCEYLLPHTHATMKLLHHASVTTIDRNFYDIMRQSKPFLSFRQFVRVMGKMTNTLCGLSLHSW